MFLETSMRAGLAAIASCPYNVDQSHTAARLIGLGYAVAKGWAVYRGDGEFEITEAGNEALDDFINPKE